MPSTTAASETFLTGQVLLGLLAFALLAIVTVVLLLWRQARSHQQLLARLEAAHSQLGELRGRDALTGLLARPALESALDLAVAASDRGESPLALLYLALDGFRPVNEGFGLPVGDAVLREAALRLLRRADAGQRVSRLGGDEFVLLLPADAAAALQAAAALVQAFRRPFEVEGQSLALTASVGVAVYPVHGSRPRLLAHAALAMRSVKHGGGDGHAAFDAAMSVDAREQMQLLQDLRGAVARSELRLVYQPKIDARSLQVTAAEALLRWQHPQRGVISPTVFIPLAERHGLIHELGHWVIDNACQQAALWRQHGLRMRVAVNLSAQQLRHEDLVPQIESALARHGMRAERLTCEITETVAMEDTAITRAAFERLRRAGVHVSIDDFGTGHSSLATLRRLPAAELKVDRAFVADLDTPGHAGAQALSIVQAIVQMAHSLGLRVVAEGVETETQRDRLITLGVDEMQGYLFARPMSARALALWAEVDGDDGGPNAAHAAFRPSLFDPTAPAPLDD
jgi:diguanylate cyclase